MAKGNSGSGSGAPPEPPQLPVDNPGNGGTCDGAADPVCFWNDKFLHAAFDDSRKKQSDQEQGGPIRVTRAGAILHAAIHDAVNGVVPVYEPYLVRERAPASSPGPDKTKPTPEAAIGTAAFVVLTWLYPSQATLFTSAFLEYFGGVLPSPLDPGLAYGVAVGGAYIRARTNDGSQRWDVANDGLPTAPSAAYPRDEFENPAEVPFRRREAAGEWRSDPLDVNPTPGSPRDKQSPVGPGWCGVRPFTYGGGSVFRPTPYPYPTEAAYTTSYNDALDRGDFNNSTDATRDHAFFWSYDDGMGTPIRLYNRLIWQVLKTNPVPLSGPVTQLHAHARLFALVNLAMADAGITTRDTKYNYNLWRPVDGIRRANEFNAIYGTSLTEVADWRPVGRPRNRPMGQPPRFHTTPPFPAYTSGHSAFGRAMFDILAKVIGPSPASFTLETEEGDVFEGDSGTGGPTLRLGLPRAIPARSFTTFDDAANDAGDSRIHLGVHWKFDDEQGQHMGSTVAKHVFDHYLRRLGSN